MTLYSNRYRVESARLKSRDYSESGLYFITICTNYKILHFGQIKDGIMILNECGRIAFRYWLEIPKHFKNVELDAFTVMPNHVHGILVLQEIKGVKNATVGLIINQFKRICTIKIRKKNPDFTWQSRFYDRIIRDENELNVVRGYIRNNPQKWDYK